ncbi:MAG: hypothetical protein U0031_12590 [Thermomicrobiales bacterium]
MVARPDPGHELPAVEVEDAIPGVHLTTQEEGIALFDRYARRSLGISGAEFLRRWDSGAYRPVPDTLEGRAIGRLVMMIPFARPPRV